LRRLDKLGLAVELHVHDEIVLSSDSPEKDKQTLIDVMTTPPEWAQGLPLDVEATVMGRYGK
jgi:hypothetical protein